MPIGNNCVDGLLSPFGRNKCLQVNHPDLIECACCFDEFAGLGVLNGRKAAIDKISDLWIAACSGISGKYVSQSILEETG